MTAKPSRRVRTQPVPGSDPTPQLPARVQKAGEDESSSWGDRERGNDEALKREKPPHY